MSLTLWLINTYRGGGKFYFVGQAVNDQDAKRCIEAGMDGVNIVRLGDYMSDWRYGNVVRKMYNKFLRFLGLAPYHYQYRNISKFFVSANGVETGPACFPTLIPNWDHSPRSGKRGLAIHNSTPEYFARHVNDVLNVVVHKDPETNLVFLKSWNEWGEGNYMEPDLKYGHGYIEILRRCLNSRSE